MKVAVTAEGPTLDATVDPRFGRCAYYLLVDTDTMDFEAIENPHLALGGGAGIQAACLIAETGARFVLTRHCGPNAHQTLEAARIGVMVGCQGTAAEAIEQLKAGRLTAIEGPNVGDHFGTSDLAEHPPDGPGPGIADARGRGMGRGHGGGMGRGLGRGMGRGHGRARRPARQVSASPPALVARVDREICIACGICCDICAEGAMALVDEVAVVSPERCTGCGDCLDPCPGQAISLAPRSRR